MKDNEKNIQPQAPVPGPVVPPVQTAVVQGPPATAAAPALTPTREVILAATANEPTTPAAKPVIVYRQRVHSKDSVRTITRPILINANTFRHRSTRPSVPAELSFLEEIILAFARSPSDRKSTRLNSSHNQRSRMPSSA